MAAHLANNTSLDLLMLQEISIVAEPGIHLEDLGDGWTLHYTSAVPTGNGGVGVLVSPRLRRLVICRSLTQRVMRVDIKLKTRNAHLFCVYGPTATHPDDSRDFFDYLSGQLDALAQRDTTLILGDLNAVMRKSARAPYALPRENANTDTLMDFVERHDLVSANTLFRKSDYHLETFVGCKRRRRNQNQNNRNATTRRAQLDHILIRHRERSRISNCDTAKCLSLKTDHKLLFCKIKLRDPLFRPPKTKPRRYFRSLQKKGNRCRFSRAFVSALENEEEPSYSDIASAIQTAAEQSVPLMKRPQTGKVVWEDDDKVKAARKRVERLRQAGKYGEANAATEDLAAVYEERRRTAVDDAIQLVAGVGHEAKGCAAWSVINRLTGRKKRTTLNLAGDTPDERRNELKDFFAGIVNAPPPPAVDITLSKNVQLPAQDDFNTGPVTQEEVLKLARESPGGKAVGMDEVPVEALRIPAVAGKLVTIINQVIREAEAPEEWRTAQIVGIPKKPGTQKIEEHRGISLMSCAAKLHNKIMHRRIVILDPYLLWVHNGFRQHRGTAQQILALRRVVEEAKVHQADLIVVFVDFRKAFDSVSRTCIQQVLRAYNVPEVLINGIFALYKDTKAAVITPDGLSDMFETSSGVLQGDTLAPFLFVLLLDWVLRTAIPTDDDGFVLNRRTSRRHPEKRLSILGYADDLALLASTESGAQRMLDSLVRTAAMVGLQINTTKTEVMTVPGNLDVRIVCTNSSGTVTPLPRCTRFVYLGGSVPNPHDDFLRRRALAWSALNKLHPVLNSEALPDKLRTRLFQAVVETVLLYNGNTWTVTDTFERELDATHSNLLRAAYKIHWPTRISNQDLYQRAGLAPPSQLLRTQRLRLAGHIIRSEEYCPQPVQRVLTWRPSLPYRRGQGNTVTYLNRLLSDAGAPDQRGAIQHLRTLAFNREI
jgi:exonuclease III